MQQMDVDYAKQLWKNASKNNTELRAHNIRILELQAAINENTAVSVPTQIYMAWEALVRLNTWTQQVVGSLSLDHCDKVADEA